jgi:hypothetical protein
MNFSERSSRASWFLAGAGSGFALLAIVGACSISTSTSEIENYDAAVQSQTAESALAFINANQGSHLVGDLIESLPPNVAVQVCSEMPSSASGRTARSCQHMREVVATTATAPAPAFVAAAPVPGASASADSLGCGGVPFKLAPASGDTVAAVEPSANVKPSKKKAATAKVVLPVQVAEAYTRETAISSGIEPVAKGRGGNSGDGGGGAHR